MRPLLHLACAFIVLVLISSIAHGQATPPATTPAAPPVLRMFVVFTAPAPGLHLYDTKGFPKLGYIADKPDLVWTELESLHQTTEKQANGKLGPNGNIIITDTWLEPVVDLGLTTAETAEFFKLTTQYKGKRTLLFLNDTPLTAPMIDGPINTPTIRLLLGKMQHPELITQQLQTLVKKPKP
jgi:hypothetical protein